MPNKPLNPSPDKRSQRGRITLYHGTTAQALDSIRSEGLKPRRETGRESNWSGLLQSKPDFVYLTDAYPVYYAFAAAQGGDDLLILKVEVDQARLYPDEDFVAFAISGSHGQHSPELIARIDPTDHRDWWQDSLALNGVVCTTSIPAEEILDHRIIRRNDTPAILSLGGDAMPTPLNYRFHGDLYRRCIACLFDAGTEAAIEEAQSFWRELAAPLQSQQHGQVLGQPAGPASGNDGLDLPSPSEVIDDPQQYLTPEQRHGQDHQQSRNRK